MIINPGNKGNSINRSSSTESNDSKSGCDANGINVMGSGKKCVFRSRRCKHNIPYFKYFITTALTLILVISLVTSCGRGSSSQNSAAYVVETMPQTSSVAGSASEFEMDNGEATEEVDFMADNSMTAGGADWGYPSEAGIEVPAPSMTEGETVANAGRTDQRKLIRNIDIDVETQSFDGLVATIRSKVLELGGYTDSVSIYGNAKNASSDRSAYITARIPAARTDEFLNTALSEGSINYMSESTQDITLKYVDMEAKKTALRVEQERLTELLAEAESVESVIAIETRLSEVRYELESIESKLRTYDNQVDYSTVAIRVYEVRVISETPESSITDKIKAGLARNIISIGNFAENAVVGFISSLPIIALIAIFCIIIYVIARKVFRKLGFSTRFSERNAGKKTRDTENRLTYAEKNLKDTEEKLQGTERKPKSEEMNRDTDRIQKDAKIIKDSDNENVDDEGGKA